MNRNIIKRFPYYLAKIQVGSRAYGYSLENSDNDYVSIYAIPQKDAFRQPKFHFREVTKREDNNWIELSILERMIILGYPIVADLLWAESSEIPSVMFTHLKVIRNSLISKQSLEKWLQISASYFEKSKQLAAIENKNALDFITVIGRPHIQGPKTAWPLRECIKTSSFDPGSYTGSWGVPTEISQLTVEKVGGTDELYSLYRHFRTTDTNIIDEKGELRTDETMSTPGTYVGIIHYDRKGHEDYKKIDRSKIVRGYSPKSMVEAFRLLERVRTYCKGGEVQLKVEKADFYLDILRANNGGAYYNSIYPKRFEEVQELVSKSTFIENINNILLTRAIEEVREKVEKIARKVEGVN